MRKAPAWEGHVPWLLMAPLNPVNRWYGNWMKIMSNFKLYSFNWLINWGFMFSTDSESHQQCLERLNKNLASTMTCNVTVNRCVYIVCEHMQFDSVLHNDLSNALENACVCVCERPCKIFKNLIVHGRNHQKSTTKKCWPSVIHLLFHYQHAACQLRSTSWAMRCCSRLAFNSACTVGGINLSEKIWGRSSPEVRGKYIIVETTTQISHIYMY